jgi:DNA-directed RNA polymerase
MFFSNDVELPEPPVMGAFNIEDVLKSNYFFA